MHYVYMLKCVDDSYYIGMTNDLERRVFEHQSGLIEGYTSSRRPIELVWSCNFATHDEAFQRERQSKGWTRAKKEALIKDDWDKIHKIVKRERKARNERNSKKQQKPAP